jgi:hypothetical protein
MYPTKLIVEGAEPIEIDLDEIPKPGDSFRFRNEEHPSYYAKAVRLLNARPGVAVEVELAPVGT